jgi:gas vesicle protein
MSTGKSDRQLLVALLLGAGVGFAAALLIASGRKSRIPATLFEKARDAAERVKFRSSRATTWRDRRTERAGRTLMDRVERMRSAGH